jgi:hypothetical protein
MTRLSCQVTLSQSMYAGQSTVRQHATICELAGQLQKQVSKSCLPLFLLFFLPRAPHLHLRVAIENSSLQAYPTNCDRLRTSQQASTCPSEFLHANLMIAGACRPPGATIATVVSLSPWRHGHDRVYRLISVTMFQDCCVKDGCSAQRTSDSQLCKAREFGLQYGSCIVSLTRTQTDKCVEVDCPNYKMESTTALPVSDASQLMRSLRHLNDTG